MNREDVTPPHYGLFYGIIIKASEGGRCTATFVDSPRCLKCIFVPQHTSLGIGAIGGRQRSLLFLVLPHFWGGRLRIIKVW